jgi:hypothetical protein
MREVVIIKNLDALKGVVGRCIRGHLGKADRQLQ